MELHVTEAFLAGLRPREHPGWTALPGDLQQQLGRWRTAREGSDPRQEHGAREAWARFPSAALRRWITMRDRSCVFPPCGASALGAEIDHTRPAADRGPTVAANLGPLCGHDHDLKDQGWTLTRPRPGWFTWASPTGHTYDPWPPPGPRRPARTPPRVRSSTEPHTHADDGPAWDHPPPVPPEDPRPPPTTTTDDPDPPPF